MQTSPPRSILDGRRTALVTAAIREFAAAGYLAASTNRIVEAAGVSKGLLFHHFGDKNGLYMETVQTYITELMSRFDERLGRTRPDLFERLRQYALAKWSLVEEEPSTLAFLQEAMTDPRLSCTTPCSPRQPRSPPQPTGDCFRGSTRAPSDRA